MKRLSRKASIVHFICSLTAGLFWSRIARVVRHYWPTKQLSTADADFFPQNLYVWILPREDTKRNRGLGSKAGWVYNINTARAQFYLSPSSLISFMLLEGRCQFLAKVRSCLDCPAVVRQAASHTSCTHRRPLNVVVGERVSNKNLLMIVRKKNLAFEMHGAPPNKLAFC